MKRKIGENRTSCPLRGKKWSSGGKKAIATRLFYWTGGGKGKKKKPILLLKEKEKKKVNPVEVGPVGPRKDVCKKKKKTLGGVGRIGQGKDSLEG